MLGHATRVSLRIIGVMGRCLEAMDDALTVRIFLLMKLSLNLLRVEELKKVGLEIKARIWFIVVRVVVLR